MTIIDALEQLFRALDQFGAFPGEGQLAQATDLRWRRIRTHFLVITADGDVQHLKKHKLTDDAIEAMFSIAGGEQIRLYQYAYQA